MIYEGNIFRVRYAPLRGGGYYLAEQLARKMGLTAPKGVS